MSDYLRSISDSDYDGEGEVPIPDSAEEIPERIGEPPFGGIPGQPSGLEIAIGSRDSVDDAFRPHEVVIINEGGVPEFEFAVIDMLAEDVVHQKFYNIGKAEALSVTLQEPSLYVIYIETDTGDSGQLFRIPCETFDCNKSTTKLTIDKDGLKMGATATELAPCPSYEC